MKRLERDTRVHEVLLAAACAPAALTDEELATWHQRWRKVYAKELHAETGNWLLLEFDWHVFSYGKHAHQQGAAAWAEYRRLRSQSFVVLSAYSRQPFGFTCKGKPLDSLDMDLDILIAPSTMAWTMSFNHERYGPYFAVP